MGHKLWYTKTMLEHLYYNYVYMHTCNEMYPHTCYYSERYIADIEIWCSNPVVSSIGFSYVSDSKWTVYSTSSMSGDSDTLVIIWIYLFCSTCILYESIPLYIIVSSVTIQYTSEHISSSFTYSGIIWLTNY